MNNKYILVLNAGSATLKFKIFNFKDLKLVKEGIIERIGLRGSFIKIGNKIENAAAKNHEQAFSLLVSKIKDFRKDIVLVGHRVVHGGEEFTKPTLISPQVLQRLQKYNQLAPLHNPVGLACIRASQKYLPKAKDVAVFDTSFFQTLPQHAFIYAIPLRFYQQYQIRRYGFHGISHQYAAEQAGLKLGKPLNKLNLITCHLGSGCSITAIKNGKAIDTSMGFTPLEGLVMSTRSGSIDPAIPPYLERTAKMSESEVSDLLNKKSGLLGLSGSMDMREILVKAGYQVKGFKLGKKVSPQDRKICRLTLAIFVYNIKKYIGAYSAILGRIDALVFTGGIGERSEIVRQLILKDLPKTKTIVVAANEEKLIASLAKKLK